LPGCFSAADTGIDEAIENAKEAIELWIEMMLDEGKDIPKPSSITELQKRVSLMVLFGQSLRLIQPYSPMILRG